MRRVVVCADAVSAVPAVKAAIAATVAAFEEHVTTANLGALGVAPRALQAGYTSAFPTAHKVKGLVRAKLNEWLVKEFFPKRVPEFMPREAEISAYWVQVAQGAGQLAEQNFDPGDGLQVETEGALTLAATTDLEVLIFDLP